MDKAEQKIKEYAEAIRKQAQDLLGDIESDILPYIEEDTTYNAMYQAGDIVRKIIEGRFEWDGHYIVIHSVRPLNPRIRLEFSACQYDTLRDKIIERMPACPKDAKIKALEDQLKQAYESRY